MDLEAKPDLPAFRAVSCSGASDVGNIADKVTRALDAASVVNMNCLTKIAIGDTTLIDKYKSTSQKAVAIDGCPVHCAKKILEQAGVDNFSHVAITDMGATKGKTPVTDRIVDRIAAEIKQQLFSKGTTHNDLT